MKERLKRILFTPVPLPRIRFQAFLRSARSDTARSWFSGALGALCVAGGFFLGRAGMRGEIEQGLRIARFLAADLDEACTDSAVLGVLFEGARERYGSEEQMYAFMAAVADYCREEGSCEDGATCL